MNDPNDVILLAIIAYLSAFVVPIGLAWYLVRITRIQRELAKAVLQQGRRIARFETRVYVNPIGLPNSDRLRKEVITNIRRTNKT